MKRRVRFGWRLPFLRNALVTVLYLRDDQIEQVAAAVLVLREHIGSAAASLVFEVS